MEIITNLALIYLMGTVATAGIFFLGATLNFLQSGRDSAQQAQILWAALIWPRTWWLLMRIPKYTSLAQWQNEQRFRQRRFREKEAGAIMGQRVVVVREICVDVGGRENLHIPIGATGRIGNVSGTKKKGFELNIEWDDPAYQGHCPYQMGIGFYGWDKWFFQEGYLSTS